MEHLHGRDEVVDRSAEAPFAIRRCGNTIMLAATAAAPVGGDELALGIEIGAGATATIGSIGAMVVWPSPEPAVSTMRTNVVVASGAHLEFAPEPTITVAGSYHRSTTRVDLAGDATCRLVEEFSIGRSGEPGGTIETSLRITRGGAPLFHHDEVFGRLAPAGSTSVGIGSARHVTTIVVVGGPNVTPETLVEAGGLVARLPLADDAFALLAAGVDRPTVLAMLDRLSSPQHAGERYGKTIRPMDAPSEA